MHILCQCEVLATLRLPSLGPGIKGTDHCWLKI